MKKLRINLPDSLNHKCGKWIVVTMNAQHCRFPAVLAHCLCRFDAINGLLVPGGSGNLTQGHPFYDNTEYLLKLAIEANDNGDYFPVCAWSSSAQCVCGAAHHFLHYFRPNPVPHVALIHTVSPVFVHVLACVLLCTSYIELPYAITPACNASA